MRWDASPIGIAYTVTLFTALQSLLRCTFPTTPPLRLLLLLLAWHCKRARATRLHHHAHRTAHHAVQSPQDRRNAASPARKGVHCPRDRAPASTALFSMPQAFHFRCYSCTFPRERRCALPIQWPYNRRVSSLHQANSQLLATRQPSGSYTSCTMISQRGCPARLHAAFPLWSSYIDYAKRAQCRHWSSLHDDNLQR
jgi:hypothetical protein